MLRALEHALLAGATWSRPAGGYFVWLEVEGADTAELARRSEADGVAFIAGSAFFPAGSGRGANAARLAFSYESPERIGEGIARLVALLAG